MCVCVDRCLAGSRLLPVRQTPALSITALPTLQRDCVLPATLQKQRGLVQQVARQQAGWDREAWPRAAWWVRGLGW